jgi:hypothetical protein
MTKVIFNKSPFVVFGGFFCIYLKVIMLVILRKNVGVKFDDFFILFEKFYVQNHGNKQHPYRNVGKEK